MSGYSSSGVNLDTFFAPIGGNPKIGDVGYEVDGVDVSNRWMGIQYGAEGTVSSEYTDGGVDLAFIFAAHPDRWQTALLTTSTVSTSWTGSRTHTVTVTIAGTTRDDFFNRYGGEIIFSGSFVGTTVNPDPNPPGNNAAQNTSMTTLMSGVSFSYDSAAYSATTTAYTDRYSRVGTGAYASDRYLLQARLVGSTQVQFNITITETDDDGYTGTADYNAPVNGSLTSRLDYRTLPDFTVTQVTNSGL